MALPLLSGALGDPTRTQRRIAPQATADVPAAEADYVDFRSNAGPMAIEQATVPRQVVSGAGIPGRELPGKYSIGQGPLDIGDVDVTNKGMLYALLNVFNGVTITDNTSWQKYLYDQLQTGIVADPYLSILNDNDVLPRTRFHNCRLGGFTLSAAVNGNLAISFPVASPEHDFHGAVSQEAGSASSLPTARRTWDGNLAADAVDKDLYIRIDSFSAGVIGWSGKVGSAAAYSATNTGQPEGEWFRFRDENGDLVGEQEESVMIYFPASATLTALDEFKILKRRTRWTQTLPVEQPIAAVQTLFEVDGVETRVEGGWELAFTYPVFEIRQDVSGKQGGSIRRTGAPTAVLTLSRDIVNLDFQESILRAAEVSCVIDGRNNAEIGASGRNHRFLVMMGAMRASGGSYDTEAGGQNIEESITLTAFEPDATFSYVADGETYQTDAHVAIGLETDQVIT